MSRLTEQEKKVIVEEKLKGTASRKIGEMIGRGKSTINDYYNSYIASLSESEEEELNDAEIETLCESPDTAISNLAKRLRTAQRTNTQLRRIQREVFDQDVNFKAHIKAVENVVGRINPNPVVELPKKDNLDNKPPATVEILFSDLQIGKVGEQFNTEKAIKAIEEYGKEILAYIDRMSDRYYIERIVFESLGDIVEDHMKHGIQSATSTDSGLSEQMANAITYVWEKVLYPLFSLGIDTDVLCIAGNHGSSQHKGMDMFKAGLYSYDYTIYKTWELLAKGCDFKNVDFIIPEGVFGYLNIYGNYLIAEHGYFNSATEKSMTDQMKKRGQQIKKHVEYFRCGDMHHTCSYDSHRLVLNGAFFGVDEGGTEYSGIIGFSSVPSQVVMLHTPEERIGRNTIKDFHVIQLA
ncbi:metallo-dependent phosphatase [Alteromonas phage vB_AmeM_PT11-V22]|uniref:Metallo-dependent phosphatase n=1 Tax=Alteromonas phage vB_AmeM_PT11-V22 TaxID=2704031 RepID=A0A6C0R2P9_9CAUD|nr:metallo-dependent phosphatase [Alteromonas phage vB_AmeM_PT11-V22]QHZ59814.1 metallo-dependent phosphatase [Alteromonas phage vB_AmeM_PT11-V22]